MGMNARVLMVGPFTAAVVPHLPRPPNAYAGLREGATIVEALRPFVFDPVSDTWVEDRSAPAPAADFPAAITIVTCNTWFAPSVFEPRFRALLEGVRARRPDVICLQEIVPESLELL